MKTLLIALLLIPSLVTAQPTDSPTKDPSGSPYFVVLGPETAEGEAEPLPLKHTGVQVKIAGAIADVEVRQIYRNTGNRVLEAIYVFPGSTRSAVHGLTLEIGERRIEAKIAEKAAAKQQYEKAKTENKTAALLEQERPNVFQMSVGHILPGDDVTVTLRYTELLTATDRLHEFIFPTVVGPRYGKAVGGETWSGNPYLGAGVQTPATWSLSMELAAGLPVKEVMSPSHQVRVDYRSADQVGITLESGEAHAADRDFVLRYRLAGERLESGLLIHDDPKTGEKFFLLTVEPPARVTPSDIPGRDYVFVVDTSGSMRGFPLDTAKHLMRDLISGLRPEDRFNVVLFAGDSRLLAEEPLSAQPANLDRAISFLEGESGGGGTELGTALERALDLPKKDGVSRSIVLLTDGFVNFEKDVFQTVRERLHEGNLFPMGIGSSVNRFLIEGLARAGRGEPTVVLGPAEAPAAADALRKMIAAPVLTGVEIDFGAGFQTAEVSPASLPDVFADKPLVVFGKVRGNPTGEIRVSGISGGKRVTLTVPVKPADDSSIGTAIPYLWARHRIATLSDDYELAKNDDTRAEVTNLGLTHGLLTQFTSFIAVDTEVRTSVGSKGFETTHQPSPLPKGVPATAVNGGTIPEPGSILLWLTGMVAMLWRRLFRKTAPAH